MPAAPARGAHRLILLEFLTMLPCCRPSAMLRLAVAFTLLLLPQAPALAADDAEPGKDKSAVALKQVVMFNAGVSYFEHRANVTGDAKLKLSFPPEKINDVLKSLIVHDPQGDAGLVTYESPTPVRQILSTFAINLSDNLTLADLLRQVRGERVRVTAPEPVTGTIISVTSERREVRQGDDDEVLQVDVLHLKTDEGLKSLPMNSISSITLLDRQLNEDLQKALEVVARSHDTNEKTVTINFRGEAERPVGVGYVQPTPIWKMSYRLALQDEQPHQLQGWAIVENTTEQDWENVVLTLVSGRPVSFLMDLYQSRFVERPTVELNLHAGVRPQQYEGNLGVPQEEKLREMQARPAPTAAPSSALRARGNAGGFGGGGRTADPFAAPEFASLVADALQEVRAMAAAGDVGELFQYHIEMPVSLQRHQSAMLPVLHDTVQGEKISIYDASVHPKHPMNGLKLTNSTDLYLMQGPITVFDDGTYAGEALIGDLAPGQERLISYALDLDVEVSPESKHQPQDLVSVRIYNGTLLIIHKQIRETTYTIKNSADQEQKVLIQQPRDPNWKLVQPEEPAEKTREAYRFVVTPPADETEKLLVREERTIAQQIALTNLTEDTIAVYINAPEIEEATKQKLRNIVQQKQELTRLQNEVNRRQQEINEITQEQSRIRENMARLDRNSQLYQRYVKKFSDQEDRIERLRLEIDETQAQLKAKRRALDDYLTRLEDQPENEGPMER